METDAGYRDPPWLSYLNVLLPPQESYSAPITVLVSGNLRDTASDSAKKSSDDSSTDSASSFTGHASGELFRGIASGTARDSDDSTIYFTSRPLVTPQEATPVTSSSDSSGHSTSSPG